MFLSPNFQSKDELENEETVESESFYLQRHLYILNITSTNSSKIYLLTFFSSFWLKLNCSET